MAVDVYALTSLAAVQEYLGITDASYTALFEHLVDRISDRVETFCGRKFRLRDFCEIVDGEGEFDLYVRNKPIVELYRLSVAGQGAFSLSNSLAVLNTARAQYAVLPVSDDDQRAATFRLVTTGSVTSDHTIDLTAAATDRIDELVTAINALATGGWSATVLSGFTYYPAADLIIVERQNIGAQGTATVQVWSDSEDGFKCERKAGRIHLAPARAFQNCCVHYSGGYTTVPDDLEHAVLELIKFVFDWLQHDGSLIGERLGDYSWRAGAAKATTGEDFEKAMQFLLANFANYMVLGR